MQPRLISYTITTLVCAYLAYRILPTPHVLAKMYGVLLLSVAVNSAVLLLMRVYLLIGGDLASTWRDYVWEGNAWLMTVTVVALMIELGRETRRNNGHGS